jgi:hypothetical protein
MGADTEPRTSRSPTRVALAILLGPAIALCVWGMTRSDATKGEADETTDTAPGNRDKPASGAGPTGVEPPRVRPW